MVKLWFWKKTFPQQTCTFLKSTIGALDFFPEKSCKLILCEFSLINHRFVVIWLMLQINQGDLIRDLTHFLSIFPFIFVLIF